MVAKQKLSGRCFAFDRKAELLQSPRVKFNLRTNKKPSSSFPFVLRHSRFPSNLTAFRPKFCGDVCVSCRSATRRQRRQKSAFTSPSDNLTPRVFRATKARLTCSHAQPFASLYRNNVRGQWVGGSGTHSTPSWHSQWDITLCTHKKKFAIASCRLRASLSHCWEVEKFSMRAQHNSDWLHYVCSTATAKLSDTIVISSRHKMSLPLERQRERGERRSMARVNRGISLARSASINFYVDGMKNLAKSVACIPFVSISKQSRAWLI